MLYYYLSAVTEIDMRDRERQYGMWCRVFSINKVRIKEMDGVYLTVMIVNQRHHCR